MLLAAAGALLVLAIAIVRTMVGTSVPAIVVARRDLVQTVVSSGRVSAAADLEVKALSAGTVTAVPVEEGQGVQAGAVLVRLDDETAHARLTEARARLAEAQARLAQLRDVSAALAVETLQQADVQLEQARTELVRTEALHTQGAVSDVQLEDARDALALARSRRAAAAIQAKARAGAGSETEVAIAAVEAAHAGVNLARAEAEQRIYRAQRPARVLEVLAHVGDVVAPSAALVRLSPDLPLELVIEPDERNLAVIATGQRALASVEAYPDQRFHAEVVEVAPVVDPRSGSVEVRLAIDDPPAFLRPEMTVSVEIVVRRRANALVVPRVAVHELANDEPWVLAVESGRATRVPVRVGATSEELVEVSGVEVGDIVLTGETVPLGRRVRPRVAGEK